jgi:hypothetical protein
MILAFLQQVQQAPDASLRAEIFSRIDAVAGKLGVAATHLWGVLVRQAYAAAATNFVWALAMFAAGYVAIRLARAGYRAMQDASTRYSDGDELMAFFVGPVAAIATILIGCACLTAGLQEIVNPEFYAWATLAEWIKVGK